MVISRSSLVLLIFILAFATLLVKAVGHDSLFDALRIVLGTAIVAIVPGFSVAQVLLGRQRLFQRLLLAVPLSIATVPLGVYLMHITLHFPINLMTTLIASGVIIALGFLLRPYHDPQTA